MTQPPPRKNILYTLLIEDINYSRVKVCEKKINFSIVRRLGYECKENANASNFRTKKNIPSALTSVEKCSTSIF